MKRFLLYKLPGKIFYFFFRTPHISLYVYILYTKKYIEKRFYISCTLKNSIGHLSHEKIITLFTFCVIWNIFI